jgi:hypothetical protein
VVKWVNDELDMVTDGVFTGTAIEPDLKTAHGRTVKAYRNLKSQVLAVRVDGACAKRASTVPKRGTPAPDPAADIDTASTSPNEWQFIISTCEERLFNLLRKKFSFPNAIFYEFKGMSDSGPVVERG